MFKRLLHFFGVKPDTSPEPAYDLWAKQYDDQAGNLMLALDETLFTDLLKPLDLNGKTVADIGCGTGRHWQKLMDKGAGKLVGFDVSREMLKVLQDKFPGAVTYRLQNNELKELETGSCDLVISTLTIAHIKNAAQALQEWCRVVKPGGHLIITDYHPDALNKGGKRTFSCNMQTVSIKNYVHTIDSIRLMAKQLGLTIVRLEEKKVDDTVRSYYENQNALAVFEAWKGKPIIYGIHLKKADDTA